MDKNIIKIIVLVVSLIAIVAAVVFLMIKGIGIGPINAVSVSEISNKKKSVELARLDLDKAKISYQQTKEKLESAKRQFNAEKQEYELISDETISIVKEATKEEEYLMEYLWITLGNYATAHNLALSVIEPGGKVAQPTTETKSTEKDDTTVSTGTGVKGDASGVTVTTNAAATGSPTDGTGTQEEKEETNPAVNTSVPNSSALTVQIKGNYIDLADFVFEVENDKSLRFRLDNIKMTSAGGNEVTATFNVKDFTVLKFLD